MSSYLNLDNIKFEEDLILRKEFLEYEYTKDLKKKTIIDEINKDNNKLILNNYQKFITNFINPNTKYDKLLLIHSTGVGKTITSLSTALNFINIYKQEKQINLNEKNAGMIYIIGFTKNVFKKELLSRAEFGIVSKSEIDELDELKKQIIKYNYDKDIAKLKELKTRYSIRLKSKRGNGYFEFIGYKELVNKIIIKNQLEYNIQLTNIKTEKELQYLIDQDIIKLNYEFLDQFHKSLIICDEIHNVYNSLDTNNWGLSLNIIFNYYKEKKSIRVLFLSATPINNKPIEIISLLKLLNSEIVINKNDIFKSDNTIKKDGYELIKKYTKGKISFLKDMDIESYPSKEIKGEIIPDIPYLKFIKCPMSDLHFKTYEYESNISNNIDNKKINKLKQIGGSIISKTSDNNQFTTIWYNHRFLFNKLIKICTKVPSNIKSVKNINKEIIDIIKVGSKQKKLDNIIYNQLRNLYYKENQSNVIIDNKQYNIQIDKSELKNRAEYRANEIIKYIYNFNNNTQNNIIINKNDIILDIGGADCSIIKELGEKLNINKQNIYCTDIIYPKDYKDGYINDINFKLLIQDTKLPFDDNSITLVTCLMTLHHVKNIEYLLNEIFRILKPNGILIIREHDLTYNGIAMVFDIMHGLYELVYTNPQQNPNFQNEYYANYKSKKGWRELAYNIGFSTQYPYVPNSKYNDNSYSSSMHAYFDIFIKEKNKQYYGKINNLNSNKDYELIKGAKNTEYQNLDELYEFDQEENINIIKNLEDYPINLELDKRYLNDIVFPNPSNNKIGLYLKDDIIKEISNSDQKWKEKYDIHLITKNKLLKNTVTGNILLENNIKKYSTKYFKLLEILKDIIINNKGKILLYHNFVQVSGINLISEILKINGYLDTTETATKYSKCNICYKMKLEHEKINHDFQPIRFIMVSSMINKNMIDKNLDNFNLNNNINGENIRIIIGSKAIKESYNLKEVQNLIVLHQPDNISTLIQIFGRAIRKNSHINLPIDNRKVNIYILASTIPDYIQKKSKKYIYSYELMKYKYKLNIYKIIQSLTNIFIESAIDRNINYNINFPEYDIIDKNDIYNINPLSKNKLIKINYNNINLSTFQSYYYKEEIDYCKYLIKRLFIEFSKVWKFDDLVKYIRNPYFKTNQNNKYISDYSIIIALDFLVFEKNNINYIYDNEEQLSNLLIDNLYNSNEKYIIDLNNNINIITYIDEYYILIPYTKSKDYDIDYEIVYSDYQHIPEQKINLNKIIEEDLDINNYDNIKKYFINKYNNVKIDKLINIISEFDFKFHLQFIEEIIEYFFNLYTNQNFQPNINHELYQKVLYFYNKFNIIIFANKLDKDLEEIYNKYIIPTKLMNFTVSEDVSDNYNYNNLINSLSEESESSNLNEEQSNQIYFNFYNKAVNETNNYLLKKNKILKIFDYLLPIGHIFDEKIKFYHPSKYWFNKLDYNKLNFKFKENDIIIGYLEKTNIGFDINFKLRDSNIKLNKVKDMRLVASGLNCLNKDKGDLIKICKKLNIDLEGIKLRKTKLCNLIKYELIKRELNERKKMSNIKYFYFYWETIN